MGYTNDELFGGKTNQQKYVLKQKYKECVDCGWTRKENFLNEEEIVCEACFKRAMERQK